MKTNCCNTANVLPVGNSKVCMNSACSNYLSPVKMKRDYSKLKLQLAVSVFAFHLLWPNDEVIRAGSIMTLNEPVKIKLSIAFSEEELKKELHNQKVLCPDEVFAQMKLESGGFASPLYQKTWNLMGMRYSFRRPTKASGIYLPGMDTIIYTHNRSELMKYSQMNHYAVYDSWQDAVADYQLWQEFNFKMTERYLNFLGEVYAEDVNYISKIKKMTSKEDTGTESKKELAIEHISVK